MRESPFRTTPILATTLNTLQNRLGMMSSKSGQAATEYLMVVALISIVIIPTTFLFYNYASDSAEEIDHAQIDKFGRDLVATAETVYYLGSPSKIVFEGRLPANVENIGIVQDQVSGTYLLSIDVRTKSGLVNFTYPTQVKISGVFTEPDISEGIKRVRIESRAATEGANYVKFSFRPPCLSNEDCTDEQMCFDSDCVPCSCGQCQSGPRINHCQDCSFDRSAGCGDFGFCVDTGDPATYCQSCGNTEELCCPSGPECKPGDICEAGTCIVLGALSVSLDSPAEDTPIRKDGTLMLQATATCSGAAGAKCGSVQFFAKQQDSGGVNQENIPDTGSPFTAAEPNPESCGVMNAPSACQKTWTLTATGAVGENKLLYAEAESITYSLNASSESKRATIVLSQCSDSSDNDGDGMADFPADPGCADANDDDETDDCTDTDGDGYYAVSANCLIGNDCNDNDGSINPGSGAACNYDASCSIPADDGACGIISCSGWYVQTGTESPTSTETCYNKADIATDRCEGPVDCKDANTADCSLQSNNAAQYTCGTCKYIASDSCVGTTLGGCTNYASGASCGSGQACDGSGNCVACDADGDGHTKIACGGDDCDDNPSACGASCFPGSTSYTTSPDGYDQDCDGIVDESSGGGGTSCYISPSVVALHSAIVSACSSYCGGDSSVSATCGNYADMRTSFGFTSPQCTYGSVHTAGYGCYGTITCIFTTKYY